MGEAEEQVLRGFYDAFNCNDVPAVERCVADDVRTVTRDGVVDGRDYFVDWADRQHRQFAITMEPEEFHDAGDGVTVVFLRVERHGRDPALGDLTAWPANVIKVRDGQIVEFEGYQNRNKALTDNGLEP
jgi:ketosteroid isomerase-like protein